MPTVLGISNGLLAIVIVNIANVFLVTPGRLVPLWLAIPFGAFTAWRANAYVRRLLSGSASHLLPPLEGFVLMAVSTLTYGAYLAGLSPGANAASFLNVISIYALYAVPVGCFGALVAVSLMLLDLGVLKVALRAR